MPEENIKETIEKPRMTDKLFKEICEKEVREYAINHIDKGDEIPNFEVFFVWSCKTLQNFKALVSTTLIDGMYYECTYNGDKCELYLDAYKKFENKLIPIEWNIIDTSY